MYFMYARRECRSKTVIQGNRRNTFDAQNMEQKIKFSARVSFLDTTSVRALLGKK